MPEFNITSNRKKLIEKLVEKLPTYRKLLHVSQSDLADKIGKSRQTVSDIERHRAPMGWDTYIAIIAYFDHNGLFEQLLDCSLRDALSDELKK